MEKDFFAVIMAGGVGSRFWPVSTTQHPKQFRDLLGSGETLIQTTFRRLSAIVRPENIYILTNERYEQLVKEQLPVVKQDHIVLEPVMRDTAPAVLLAALKIQQKNPNALMLMAPSDHWIEDEMAFKEDIQLAFNACIGEDKILTLGINPTFPNTGYGYIKYDKNQNSGIKQVEKFTEKPSYAKAQDFLKEGNYLWNAGIFLWNIDFIIRSFSRNLPEMYQLFTQNLNVLNTSGEKAFLQENYPKANNVSIDYGILEKEEDTVFVIPASFDWNDLGTWGSLYSETGKDEHENALLNVRLYAEDASGNILSSANNKVMVVEGLKNYIVVDEEEVLLIVPKDREQDIKGVREKGQRKFGENIG